MPRLREDQAIISVQLGGVQPLDANDVPIKLPKVPTWTVLEGGDPESDDVYTHIGWRNGLNQGVNLGGPAKRSDLTVSVHYSTDFDAIIDKIERLAGKRSMSVSWTPVDADGNVNGNTHTITGILKTVTRPNFNHNTVGAAMLSLVMACNL